MIEQLAEMPTYETYKNSGVEWLGEIPAHWRVGKGKWLFSKADRQVRDDDDVITCFRDGQVTLRKNRRTEGFTNAIQEHRYQGIRKGDLVIHAMDAFAGAIGVSDSDGKSSPVYSACIPRISNTVDVYFYAYFLRSLALSGFIESLAKGIRERSTDFRFKDFSVLNLSFPPLNEQIAIAAFLDRKTAQIDQAVAIKEQQIALLKERKQILIQNAVTRGLNPNAPMRDSGVEWIGEIPAHWEIKRAKYLFKEIDERSVSGDEELLSVSHMTGVTPRSEKNVTMFMAEDYSGSKTCQNGDLVFNIMWAWMGALGVSDRTGIVSSSYGVFRQLKNMFNPNYLEFLLKTTGYIEHYNKVSTGLHSSRLRFYSHMFFNMELGFPSKDEQDEIVTHIETQSAKIDQAISIQQQQIGKLKEYKATLINSAVTGKIRVPDSVQVEGMR
ncbi:MAG: restriction endonuclease subunit S [Methylococcales bacterium]|nr:restriction endonuclease subunit S [Methylococcales bacterium]